jgi:hypothetical protein
VDESPLTGESVPGDKDAGAVADADAGPGDRLGMVFMNTTVTRGRAEVVITRTGMQTEMGAVAGMLAGDEPGRGVAADHDGHGGHPQARRAGAVPCAGLQRVERRQGLQRTAGAGARAGVDAHAKRRPPIADAAGQLAAFQKKLRRLDKVMKRGWEVFTFAGCDQDRVSKPTAVPHLWQVSPNLYKVRGHEYWVNFQMLVSDDGHALLIDCGLFDCTHLDRVLADRAGVLAEQRAAHARVLHPAEGAIDRVLGGLGLAPR